MARGLRDAAAGLALGALLLVPLELGARRWCASRGDALDKTALLLRLDPRLGWRQREGWRGTFLGRRVETDGRGLRAGPEGPAGAPLVLVLGPSSTFGWGVEPEQTYAAALQARLGGRARVLNGGQIGYSSWQGAALYRELRALRPAVVVVAYGVNDADRHRFHFQSPRPDSEALPPAEPAWRVALRDRAGRLQSARLLARALLSALPRRGGAMPPPRVSDAQFLANMETLAALAREDGARPVFLTTPFGLAPAAPPEGALDAAYAAGDAAALRRLEPGRVAADLARRDEALRRLGRRLAVPVLDAAKLLEREPALFLEPVHPSPEGHRRLGEALADLLERERML